MAENNLLYNLEALNMLVDGNPQFLKHLVELFVETTPPIVQDLKESMSKSDWENVYAHAHKIKPTIDSMGIHSLKYIIVEIEEQARNNNTKAEIPELVNKLENRLNEVIGQLKVNELQ